MAGEVTSGREAADVTDVSDDDRSHQRSDSVETRPDPKRYESRNVLASHHLSGHYALVMPHPRDRELARLVDERLTDEVLSIVPLATIADTWCDYFAVDHGVPDEDYEPDWWPVEFFYSCVGPDLRHDALLALVERAHGSHRSLSNFGAGPFEDYIDEFDSEQVEWIERNAAFSSSFREALQNMRLSHELSDDLRIRINCAAGFPADCWLKFNP